MSTIKTLSHKAFDEFCSQQGLNDANVELQEDSAFISIIGTEECRKYYLEDETGHWFKESHPNVLNLEFDDITEDMMWKGRQFKAMTKDHAKEVIEFIENNKNKNFYVHCKAGISRSGAISRFIYDFYNKDGVYSDIDFEKYNSYTRPNNHILILLKRCFYEKYGLFVDNNREDW